MARACGGGNAHPCKWLLNICAIHQEAFEMIRSPLGIIAAVLLDGGPAINSQIFKAGIKEEGGGGQNTPTRYVSS